MKTHYVHASIGHQKNMAVLLNLVKKIIGFRAEYENISPLSYTFTENTDERYPEIILNQRFSLNQTLVRFSLTPKIPFSEQEMEPSDILQAEMKKLIFNHTQTWRTNPHVEGRNFFHGISNLTEMLRKSIIFAENPPIEQRRTGVMLSDNSPGFYMWNVGTEQFSKIGSVKDRTSENWTIVIEETTKSLLLES